MQCPSCKKNQPMSFRCKSCGAELVKRFAGASARSGGGAAAAAVAMDPPMNMPAMAPPVAAAPSFAGDAPLASRGSRLAAALLDVVFLGLAIVPGIVVTVATHDTPQGMGMAVGLGVGLSYVGYMLHILVRDGQTLGKKVMKIRIVNYADGGRASGFKILVMRGGVNGILSNIPFYALIDVLFIFGSEQRCLHDLIAKTKVVQA